MGFELSRGTPKKITLQPCGVINERKRVAPAHSVPFQKLIIYDRLREVFINAQPSSEVGVDSISGPEQKQKLKNRDLSWLFLTRG